jgi:hypothetical protein
MVGQTTETDRYRDCRWTYPWMLISSRPGVARGFHRCVGRFARDNFDGENKLHCNIEEDFK